MKEEFEVKLKGYPHFSRKHDFKDKSWVTSYCLNEDSVANHAFYPFIHRVDTQRRFRRVKEGATPKERAKRKSSKKKREISYANHLDSAIYSYYSQLLQAKYETYLKENQDLSDSVLAYRSKEKLGKPSSNIHFAKEVFNYIRTYPENRFRVLTLDISSFFDNLSHRKVKSVWKQIMEFTKGMPDDHYNVFKSITKYSYVDFHDVFKTFSDIHKVKRPHHLKRLKEDDLLSFCSSPKMFRERVAQNNLIRTPKEKNSLGQWVRSSKGIPQGSPISPTIANIYMLDFDEEVSNYMQKCNGLYRRYSDDLFFVYPENKHEELQKNIHSWLSEHCLTLEAKDEKKQEFRISRKSDGQINCEQLLNTSWHKRSIDYLGLTFNGEVIRLKSASLAKYYRKSKKSVYRSASFANTMGRRNGKPYIFKNIIYKRHTHLGAQRRMIFKRSHKDANGKWVFKCSKKHSWGNYLTYGYKAKSILDGTDTKAVKNQLKNHFKNINKVISIQTKSRKLKDMSELSR